MGSFLSRISPSHHRKTTSAQESKMAPVAFNYYGKAQSTYKPPLIANENAFLGDVFSRYVRHGRRTKKKKYNRLAADK